MTLHANSLVTMVFPVGVSPDPFKRLSSNNNKTATSFVELRSILQEESSGLVVSLVIEGSPDYRSVLQSIHPTSQHNTHHGSSMQDDELHGRQRTHVRQYLLLSIGHAGCAVISRQGCHPTCLSALRRRHASRSTPLAEFRFIRLLVYSSVVL